MAARTDRGRRTRDLIRLKVSLLDTDPEIWRLLELDADLTLDRVHEALQIAMGWRNSHLHLFTDTDPYQRLRPVDGEFREPRRWMTRADLEELDGLPETEWTLGQVLTEETGPLFYEYDFGDGWTHRLEFVEQLTVPAAEPIAHVERGERRAPPEDCGGSPGYAELLDALADPGHERHQELTEWVAATAGPWQPFDPDRFDVDAVNRELALLFPSPDDAGRTAASSDTPLLVAALVERVPPTLRPEFRSSVRAAALETPAAVEPAVAERMTAPYRWLIRRVGADGLALTAAGWLPPAVVAEAMDEFGWDERWIGKGNREEWTQPVRRLREQAQRLGLVRKLKGRLVLPVAVRKLDDDPVELWSFVARSLAHRHGHDAERDATLLLALELAAGRAGSQDGMLRRIGFGLEILGWQAADGWGLTPDMVRNQVRSSWDVFAQLGAIGELSALDAPDAPVPPEGRAFVRAVLQS
ncbi:plasmid pRiA4b ORF-3 family protein [uncultured Kocuria sp.]|uniref:plasmid pRiA4b ORF-3 family protein n=1 Tax=uncultured Kocuria sp. TaxID=259305 RepID=UPI00260B4277|nr:plasmid pRiA4b ORF-3 family protein [uncultured Kocuria sp.]